MLHNIIPDIPVEDFLIIFHPRLVVGVNACQGPFVGDGEEEEIHEGADVKGVIFRILMLQLMRPSAARACSLARRADSSM